jgi:hypothetical protein
MQETDESENPAVSVPEKRVRFRKAGGEKMVKTLTVRCPHCNQVADIFLSTNASVIILNCPTCFSPIMYFEDRIFLLSKNQVDAIKDNTTNASILKMLDRIAHSERKANRTAGKMTEVQTAKACRTPHLSVVPSKDKREKYICDDDITNLKIELALCTDSKDFIESL